MTGLPVTDPRIVRRRLFLIGGRDLGADGIAHPANVGHWHHAMELATQSDFFPCQSSPSILPTVSTSAICYKPSPPSDNEPTESGVGGFAPLLPVILRSPNEQGDGRLGIGRRTGTGSLEANRGLRRCGSIPFTSGHRTRGTDR